MRYYVNVHTHDGRYNMMWLMFIPIAVLCILSYKMGHLHGFQEGEEKVYDLMDGEGP